MRGLLTTALLLFAAVSASAQAPGRSTSDGVYTLGQARRGAVHVERCTPCHGSDLEGDLAPALFGPRHLERWSGRSLADLFERIVANFEGLARTGGADEEAPLAQRAADFTAYLLLQNGFPAGTTDLPADAERLRSIRIRADRPHPTVTPPARDRRFSEHGR